MNDVAASVEGLFQPSTGAPKVGVQQGGVTPILRQNGSNELKVFESPEGDAPVIVVPTDENAMRADGLTNPGDNPSVIEVRRSPSQPSYRRPRSPSPRQRVSFAAQGGDSYDPYLDSMDGNDFDTLQEPQEAPQHAGAYRNKISIVKGE